MSHLGEVHDTSYAACGKHTYYAIGDDGVKCCAEMSCKFYINNHREM